MYRHGDVILRQPVKIPESAARRQSDVVAEGEATGHAHRIRGGSLWDNDGDLYLVAGDDAALTHEEHAREEIAATEPGFGYPVIIQREYDDEQEWRQVAD